MYKNIKFTKVNHLLSIFIEISLFALELVSNLTRRLLIVESEKSESDRILETIRIRNDDLKRKYEQLMLDNNHRIHIQEHVQEVSEMKRLTGSKSINLQKKHLISIDELSQKHANELQVLLRRVQVKSNERFE